MSNKNSKERKTIVLICQGGAGDILSATPMIRYFRTKYPDDEIVVGSFYTQLLENNPNVDKVVSLLKPMDFYTNYVLEKNLRFYKKHFIYDAFHDEVAKGCLTLPELVCKLYDAEYDGNPPDYFVTRQEEKTAKYFLGLNPEKKKVLIQTFCAVPSDGKYEKMVCGGCQGRGIDHEGNRCKMCGGSGKLIMRDKTNSMKDINPEILSPIFKKYADKIDFLQIGLEGEPLIEGAYDCLGMPMRDAAALIKFCDSFIFAESLFAHIAGALQKPGLVIFQNMSPDFFGYESAYKVFDPGGCKSWPCNRPVGALFDLAPGYRNVKAQNFELWNCDDQKCAKIKSEKIEEILLRSLEMDNKIEEKKVIKKEDESGFNEIIEVKDKK